MAARVETERLVLRPWREADVDLLREAIASSLEHLRAWLPWAIHEPEPRDAKLRRIRDSLQAFEAGTRWTYGLFDPGESRLLGGVGIEPVVEVERLPVVPALAREIGYWLRADAVGHGLASEAVAALSAVGFREARLAWLQIECDPGNARSAAVPRRVGYTHLTTLKDHKRTPTGETRDTMVWVMDAASFPGSHAADVRYRSSPRAARVRHGERG